MPMHFRAFVAVTVIAALAQSALARFAGRADETQPRSSTVYSARACDARLVASLEPRESQRPTRSGPRTATRRLIRSASPGIEYRIPANAKATLFAHTLTGFDAVVEFAAGRGRLDIVANPASPELVA